MCRRDSTGSLGRDVAEANQTPSPLSNNGVRCQVRPEVTDETVPALAPQRVETVPLSAATLLINAPLHHVLVLPITPSHAFLLLPFGV
ncbi:hypothetical protein E2C01_042973 [Portunus trituberculatus]|uniref:Uncharacterized protein n=1 Tax=Portunus trituberculatus TaxID=210409 RepID=A0A5B7FW96_PORTR|nr:hypothetical protein [Portunus trituberculatus]